MIAYNSEPVISVGLMENVNKACFETVNIFLLNSKELLPGKYTALCEQDKITLTDTSGKKIFNLKEIILVPKSIENSAFFVHDIKIGIDFHWERYQNQKFRGSLKIKALGSGTFTVINIIPLEMYLEAVICSEMSASSPDEFLKSHCVISRSWLLAQLEKKKTATKQNKQGNKSSWTDAGKHKDFDVCADDHCQRYHGIGPINTAVKKALQKTRGTVLLSNDTICDTRFSKCCGGITERFSTCWEDTDFDYLTPVLDTSKNTSCSSLETEEKIKSFIESEPEAFCNVKDKALLSRILPGFDLETHRFFRWQINYSQKELKELLLEKTGTDLGNIIGLRPVLRGASGRIIKLKITGDKGKIEIGKELAIRKALSKSHLYSSAFTVTPYGKEGAVPDGFILRGAGWGHGVGLCQIGAAVMADKGYDYQSILYHYFKNTTVKKIY